jgi:hypothetical protein
MKRYYQQAESEVLFDAPPRARISHQAGEKVGASPWSAAVSSVTRRARACRRLSAASSRRRAGSQSAAHESGSLLPHSKIAAVCVMVNLKMPSRIRSLLGSKRAGV